MPFTFLAHQAPVLPLKMGQPARWDGLALVVGSMAPDLAYVSSGWGYGPAGIPLYFDGHRFQNQLVLALFATVLTIVVRRLVLPVAPLFLPDQAGSLRTSLLASSQRRPAVWTTYLSALVGALTHIAIDAFTHIDGFVVTQFSFFTAPWFSIAGKEIALYKVLQYSGTLVLGIWCIVLMRRWWGQTRPESPNATLGRGGRIAVIAGATVGLVDGVFIALARTGPQEWYGQFLTLGFAVIVMTFCWVAFAGLLVGCVAACPFVTSLGRSIPGGVDAPP